MKAIACMVINVSARSNHTESATQQWRKSAPPILSTSECEFNGVRLCAHARKTIPLQLIARAFEHNHLHVSTQPFYQVYKVVWHK